MLRCGTCDARFSPDRRVASYEQGAIPDDPPCDYGTDFYLEVGAGLDAMLAPLGWMRPGTGSLLEIGGSVGFVSDYAQVALGWKAKGYDPSLMAAVGRKLLGLDIVLDYFQDDTPLPEAGYDVVSATELIEHVPDPVSLLRTLSRGVKDQGVLVLTTPDGEALAPQTPMAMLSPLVSPSLHLTLFTRTSLERILRAVGFSHVRVRAASGTLWAHASHAPLPPGVESGTHGDLYRTYLKRRLAPASGTALYPRLESGLRYRLLKELVNHGDYQEAMAEFSMLADAALRQYGLDLSRPEALLDLPQPPSIEGYVAAAPTNLTGLLYFRAILANNLEGDAGRAALYAAAAATTGVTMRQVLQGVGMDNGEAGMLVPVALRLALGCLAGQGADIRPLVDAIGQAPATDGFLLSPAEQDELRDSLANAVHALPPANTGTIPLERIKPELVDLCRSDLPRAARAMREALENAVDASGVWQALNSMDVQTLRQWPGLRTQGAKLALIRLTQLSAFEEAKTLFKELGNDSWRAEEPLAIALTIIADMAAKAEAENELKAARNALEVKAVIARLTAGGAFRERPDLMTHIAKVAFIRLVQLSAYGEARALFATYGNDGWREDGPVATALGMLPPVRPPFRRA
ncbi:class I SAM-dependent methyltransferase [Nitrospirillum iridis]|uniref:class I SAM-dependent methyltransferase n=1 Tax=Nitrospirillum iridis TaxID=765888 RepID=UPI00161D714A|nr:class I SAM-dependent methyltransferase [Nitrospirillum iridis]